MSRNPNDRTRLLHRVHVQSQRIANGRFYAYGWGGGLADPVTTDLFDTEEEAFKQLETQLKQLGRKPE